MVETDMTIFYYKSDGDIYSACSGIQPIESFLGTHATDLMQIISSVVLTYDQYVLTNSSKLKINLVTKSLELKAEIIPQYPLASSN